jgi:CBS domain-containing protein
MLLNGFRHLPVVEGRTVCGVVSLRDLFAARIRRPPAG